MRNSYPDELKRFVGPGDDEKDEEEGGEAGTE